MFAYFTTYDIIGTIKHFDIYGNGRQNFGSDTITNNVCSNEYPAISFSDSYDKEAILAELSAEIPADHIITITKADKDALDAELNS